MQTTLIEFISAFSACLPIIVFFFRFKKNSGEVLLWVIFFYLTISFLADMASLRGLIPQKLQTLQTTVFTIFEFLIFISYLALSLKNKLVTKISIAIALIYTIFSTTYILVVKKRHGDYYTLVATIENVIIITFCVVVLYNFIKTPQILFIYSYSQFWIVTGILFYLTGTFFLSLIVQELPKQDQEKYWVLNLFFNILKNIFFSISYLLKKNNLIQQSSLKNQYYI